MALRVWRDISDSWGTAMSERKVALLAVRLRPWGMSRLQAMQIALAIYRPMRYCAWAIRNPRIAWFAARVRWHYDFGLPMPQMPPYSIEV
jgi:hypothetical protein